MAPLLILLTPAGYGQTTLSGTIADEKGQPVEGASVIVRKQPGGPILAFSLSTATGAYSVNLDPAVDSFWITVSHLSYTSQEKAITGRPDRLNWVLTAQVYQLPEMVLSQPAVIRRGDTLVFDVSQLREAQDETIEQVLARIPGITVESGGRILYQDLPISRFYIEGLDLLEGRYALATRNLNVEAIRDIEILERHQPIRALDSLISPPNAAINLRLKSKVVFTGEAKAGSGLSPPLYQAGGNLFGFQKHRQLNLLATANTVGQRQRDNFRGFYEEASLEPALVSPTVILPPLGIDGGNALDNQELTGGANFLRRTGPYGQLKFQAFATADRLRYRGRIERTWRDAGQEVRFVDLLRATEASGLLNSRLIYEWNKPRFYAKASLEAERGDAKTTADNQINARASREDLERDKWTIRGRWETILRKGNKAYRLWSRIDYQDEDIGLELRPLDLVVAGFPREQVDQAVQVARERSLASDTYTGFILRRRQLTGLVKTGMRTHWRRIGSDLAKPAVDGSLVSLGPLFVNAIDQLVWAPYLEQEYSWERRDGEWKLFVPVAFHRLAVRDDFRAIDRQRGLVVFQPRLEYLSRGGRFSAQFAYSRDYNQDQLFYTGFLLRTNRQFDRQAFAINRRDRYELSLRHQGKGTRSGLFHNSRLNLSVMRADLITTTAFDSLGQVSLPVAASNVQRRASWQNRLEATPWSALQVKLETDYTTLVRPARLNGNRLNIRIHQAWAEPYLVYSFGKSVLSCRPRVSFFASNLAEAPVWQTQVRWVFFHQFPGNGGKVNLSFDQYRTTIGRQAVGNRLFNIRYENRIPFWNLDVSLHLNNLTNEGNFTTFLQESFFEELGYYRLRPRQVILMVERKF